MNKATKYILLFILITCIGYILYALYGNMSKKFNWNDFYKMNSNQPYGLSFLKNILEARATMFKVFDQKPAQYLKANSDSYQTLIVVGEKLYWDSLDYAAIYSFLERKNNLFLALELPVYELLVKLSKCSNPAKEEYSFYYNIKDSTAKHNFLFKSIYKLGDFSHTFHSDYYTSNEYNWNYFSKDLFLSESCNVEPLGFIRPDYIDYVSLSYEKGKIFIFLNPVCLTNYFYDQQEGKEFIDRIFSFVYHDKILWDNYSAYTSAVKNSTKEIASSPLDTILSYAAFRWAWFSLLTLFLIYFLLGRKHKFRPIPLGANEKIDRLQFANLLANIFRRFGNNRKIATYRLNYFAQFVRKNLYYKEFDFKKADFARIAMKAGVSINIIHNIITHANFILNQDEISKEELQYLHEVLNEFYYNTKIK